MALRCRKILYFRKSWVLVLRNVELIVSNKAYFVSLLATENYLKIKLINYNELGIILIIL